MAPLTIVDMTNQWTGRSAHGRSDVRLARVPNGDDSVGGSRDELASQWSRWPCIPLPRHEHRRATSDATMVGT